VFEKVQRHIDGISNVDKIPLLLAIGIAGLCDLNNDTSPVARIW